MSSPLLTTKINIPPLRPELVSRPRLFERLDEGLRLGHKLTLGGEALTLTASWLTRR